MPYKDLEKRRACRARSKAKFKEDHPERAAAQQRAANQRYQARQAAVREAIKNSPEALALHAAKKLRQSRNHQLNPAGWTHEAYEAAFVSQSGRCAICRAEPVVRPGNTSGRLCADHEHTEPPKPRELICHACNVALGQLRDNPGIAEAAAAYLRKWNR